MKAKEKNPNAWKTIDMGSWFDDMKAMGVPDEDIEEIALSISCCEVV